VVGDFLSTLHYSTVNNNPFVADSGGDKIGTTKDLLGESVSSAWLDNIHNHLIGTK